MRFREDLTLDGKQPRTIDAYLYAVSQLARHFATSPDKLSETQVREYLLWQRKHKALNSMRPILAGIKKFYLLTEPRDWKTLAAMRLPKHRTMPRVLVPERVWELIQATNALHLKTMFRTAFTCGLRTGDLQALTVHDIDKDRMSLNIRSTKGLNQRCVPLPPATYQALRDYWVTHRNKLWLFPSRQSLSEIATTDRPVSERTIQRGFREVVRSLDWDSDKLVPHTLRHSYATAMLDEGVNLKVLQMYLGHKNLQATEIYLHLTRRGDDKARRIVETFFNGPTPAGQSTPPETPPETPPQSGSQLGSRSV